MCEEYRRALPDLRTDLYGSMHAADCLLYCGDRKSALKIAIGYNLQPLWPVALDSDVLARIRIASGQYAQAAELLRGNPSILLYEALAESGRRAEAERILERLAPKTVRRTFSSFGTMTGRGRLGMPPKFSAPPQAGARPRTFRCSSASSSIVCLAGEHRGLPRIPDSLLPAARSRGSVPS